MKIFGKFIFVTVFLSLAIHLGAQTINLENVTVKQAINEVRAKTGYSFVFSTRDLKTDMIVSVKADSVDEAVRQIVAGQNVSWSIDGINIIIRPLGANDEKNRVSNGPFVVRGTVVDTKGEPLAGVGVLIVGSSAGTITDMDGVFSVELSSAGNVLFSSLGFTDQTMFFSKGTDITVIMEEDTKLLSEVVVVGYGTQKKVNITGAVSVVDAKQVEDRASSSLANLLQGTVPGLTITTSSGRPGSDPSVNIRGINSINGGNPLVLIDGVEGSMNLVNPADVESISVVKDASAAVYGARASFGVILVSTKSGKENDGKVTVRYSGRAGWSSPTASTDFETRGYYGTYINELFYKSYAGLGRTSYTSTDYDEMWARRNDAVENPERPWVIIQQRDGRESYAYYANTDWYHVIFKDVSPTTIHNLSISGASGKVRYFLSGGYDYTQGLIKQNTDYNQKVNFRSKIDFDINKWLNISNNTSFINKRYFYPGPEGVSTIFSYMTVGGYPCFPEQNPDGSSIYYTGVSSQPVFDGLMTSLDYGRHKNTDRLRNVSTTTELTATPLEQLEIKANYTYTNNSAQNSNRSVNTTYSTYPGEYIVADTGVYENYLKEVYSEYNYHSVNVYATYKDTFKDSHNLKITAGYNWETKKFKDIKSIGYNLLTDDLNDLNLIGPGKDGEERMTVSGGQNAYSLMGVFFRINYDYKGKYLVEASGRYDGTSRFASGHRWGFFPSASIGWRISEEDFFSPAKKWFNNLKLRASYGSLGNQQVGYYDYVRTVSIGSQSYLFGGSTLPTTAVVSAPNSADLTWETAVHMNVGLDMAFLGNRLNFSAEGYIRDTRNMLAAGIALPATYGAASPKSNSADLRTRGYELTLSWRDGFNLFGRRFEYNAGVTFNDYITKITRYNNPEKSFAKTYYEGMTLGEIWGYKTDGLFFSDMEAAAYPVDQTSVNYLINSSAGSERGVHGGDVRFVDLDGDNVITIGENTVSNPGDRYIIGNSQPRYQYGINLGFKYFGFDFSIFFQGVGHQDWYPGANALLFWSAYARPYATFLPKDFHTMYWTEDNKDAYFPRPRGYVALNGTNRELTAPNDRYLQNVAYCRLKNLAVGYSLPQKWAEAIKMQSLRIYFTGENLAYWCPGLYSSYIDPEQAINGGDLRVYSWMKTFMFGIDITF